MMRWLRVWTLEHPWLVLIPVMQVIGWVTLSNLLNLFVPWFPHLEDGKHFCFIVLRETESIFVE